MSLNVTLDRTKLDGGDSRCCNLVVLDGLFGEAERRELVKVALGEDGDKPAEPPSSMRERATADGKDLPCHGARILMFWKRLSSGQTPIVCEIWSRLCLMYPEYNICLQPGNDNFIDPRDGQGTEPKHACWPVVGNAPVHGDTFRYHYDGDPASFPNSNWTRQFGRYVNHEPGKPLFVSLLVYLNRFWPKRFLAETLFLDDDTDTGVYVRPKGYRCVLMDQDLMHRYRRHLAKRRRPATALFGNCCLCPSLPASLQRSPGPRGAAPSHSARHRLRAHPPRSPRRGHNLLLCPLANYHPVRCGVILRLR